MKDRLSLIAVIFTVVLLLGGYVGSYYALVRVGPQVQGTSHLDVNFVASYRAGGRNSGKLYWPVNWLDRKVRSDTWSAVNEPAPTPGVNLNQGVDR